MHIRIESAVPRSHLHYRGVERCALILGDRTADGYTVRRFVPVPNRHTAPEHRFSVVLSDAAFLLGDATKSIIGVVHSHAHGDPMPSRIDLTSIEDGYIGAVFCGLTITSWYERNNPLLTATVSFVTGEGAVA